MKYPKIIKLVPRMYSIPLLTAVEDRSLISLSPLKNYVENEYNHKESVSTCLLPQEVNSLA